MINSINRYQDKFNSRSLVSSYNLLVTVPSIFPCLIIVLNLIYLNVKKKRKYHDS